LVFTLKEIRFEIRFDYRACPIEIRFLIVGEM